SRAGDYPASAGGEIGYGIETKWWRRWMRVPCEGAMAMTIGLRRSLLAWRGGALVLALALAGCSGIPGFGREEKPPDPNAYPAKYKTDLLEYLETHASELEGVRNAALSAPALVQL